MAAGSTMQTGAGRQTPFRQHLIDPETCIRCNTCESRCPTKAIRHESNYVVDPAICNYCMRCVRPCPTGAVDHWFLVESPYSVAEQLAWSELPKKSKSGAMEDVPDAFDGEALRLLEDAHQGMGGRGRAPEIGLEAPDQRVYARQPREGRRHGQHPHHVRGRRIGRPSSHSRFRRRSVPLPGRAERRRHPVRRRSGWQAACDASVLDRQRARRRAAQHQQPGAGGQADRSAG